MESNELLCAAVKTEQCEIAEILIKSGADVNYVDVTGKFPLFYACENKKLAQIKLLLSHGADIGKRYNGISILDHVCAQPDLEIIKLLMDNSADPNVNIDKCFHNHPLMNLVMKNNVEGVLLLLSYSRTNINFQDNEKITSLMFAVRCNLGIIPDSPH